MLILSWKHFGFTWETVNSALQEIPLDIYLIDNAATPQKKKAFSELAAQHKQLHYYPLEKNWGTVAYNKLFQELGYDRNYLTSSNDVLFPAGWYSRFMDFVAKTEDDTVIFAPYSISYFKDHPLGQELLLRYEQARKGIQNFPEDESIQSAQQFVEDIYQSYKSFEKAREKIEASVSSFSPSKPERGDVLFWKARGLQTFGGFNEEWGPMATEHEVFTRCHICGLETSLVPTYIHHSVNISTRYWDRENRLEPWNFPECPFPPARMKGNKGAIFSLRREKLREWGSYGTYTFKQNGMWYTLKQHKFVLQDP